MNTGNPGDEITFAGAVNEDQEVWMVSELGIAVGAIGTGDSHSWTRGTGGVRGLSDQEALRKCWAAIVDGRLNMFDHAALAVIYLTGNGYDVYQIDPATSQGTMIFRLGYQDVADKAKAAAAGGEDILIESNNAGINLWALANGQCELSYVSQDGQVRPFVFPCNVK